MTSGVFKSRGELLNLNLQDYFEITKAVEEGNMKAFQEEYDSKMFLFIEKGVLFAMDYLKSICL